MVSLRQEMYAYTPLSTIAHYIFTIFTIYYFTKLVAKENTDTHRDIHYTYKYTHIQIYNDENTNR